MAPIDLLFQDGCRICLIMWIYDQSCGWMDCIWRSPLSLLRVFHWLQYCLGPPWWFQRFLTLISPKLGEGIQFFQMGWNYQVELGVWVVKCTSTGWQRFDETSWNSQMAAKKFCYGGPFKGKCLPFLANVPCPHPRWSLLLKVGYNIYLYTYIICIGIGIGIDMDRTRYRYRFLQGV